MAKQSTAKECGSTANANAPEERNFNLFRKVLQDKKGATIEIQSTWINKVFVQKKKVAGVEVKEKSYARIDAVLTGDAKKAVKNMDFKVTKTEKVKDAKGKEMILAFEVCAIKAPLAAIMSKGGTTLISACKPAFENKDRGF